MPILKTLVDSVSYKQNLITNPICPHCKTSILPILSKSHMSNSYEHLYAIMLCPNCSKYYFESFVASGKDRYISNLTLPTPSPNIDIPDKINEFYPDFYRIYLQAAKAEVSGLDEICGMGYRKALETLVKHFVCKISPDESETILKEPLGTTISRIDSTRVKTLARAATWLGNDQTHLVTKHPDHSLPELKAFILALCQYILSEEEFGKATELLNHSKR